MRELLQMVVIDLAAARLKKNSSNALRARGRSGSMTRPKAILTENRSDPSIGTSSKWFGNVRTQ